MTKSKIVCLIAFILSLLLLASSAWAEPWTGEVIKVIDGDSLIVARGRTPVRIRLWGIDCPEWNQPFGKEAKEFTHRRAFGRRVLIAPKDVDRYGRVVAEVMLGPKVDGDILNAELLEAGLAWWSKKYAPDEITYRGLMFIARTKKRGLWIDAGAVAPWEWKKR